VTYVKKLNFKKIKKSKKSQIVMWS